MNQPIYKVEVKAFLCSIEIEVNGIPCFSYFNEAQIATDIPINNLLFSSGEQDLKFKISPLFNNKDFHKDAQIELNIFVKEANDFYLKKQVIHSFVLDESLENKPFYENILNFDASFPYHLDVSKIKYDFSREEQDELFSEVYQQYEMLASYIKDDDLKQYNQFTTIRFDDFVKAHYLEKDRRQYFLNKALFSYKDYELSLVPKEEYTLKYCFNNRLVYLEKLNNAPGLVLEDKNSKEEGLHFIESAIFFRNNQGHLELFR
ncbi:hypothetical protein [Chryseobacterium sp. Marseille-Q3244]|uniref:hypothetical protein n=1 Tax=Chryseobacterium sp. Marseille-Q3244 TaxID=2758092 RepID=UPI002024D32A|nr:hypothetical protein [Chryseobacterium sp. Marseille-Q3244]